MGRVMRAFLAVFAMTTLVAAGAVAAQPVGAYRYRLPAGMPPPSEVTTNPTTEAKVELGRRLFYDGRLARDGLRSCATCHVQSRAFTDPSPFSWGVTGEHTSRQTPSLANAGYLTVLTWANPDVHTLEEQAPGPMFGLQPIEMGMEGRREEMIEQVKAEPIYRELFARAFPEDGQVSIPSIIRAIAAFERTLISLDSPYDRSKRGDVAAMSASAKRGEALFMGDRLKCGACHAPPFFTDAAGASPRPFHNTGLYNIDERGGYPATNTGIFRITAKDEDMGRFRTPTLRNIAVTGPYMHDGSLETLDQVIDFYGAGGRSVPNSKANSGDGRASPLKDPRIAGFVLTAEQRADLRAFLEALTDEHFLSDPALGDPWVK